MFFYYVNIWLFCIFFLWSGSKFFLLFWCVVVFKRCLIVGFVLLLRSNFIFFLFLVYIVISKRCYNIYIKIIFYELIMYGKFDIILGCLEYVIWVRCYILKGFGLGYYVISIKFRIVL